MSSDVVLNLKGLNQFVSQATGTTSNPEIVKLLKRIAAIYRADMQHRFVLYSRGGGTWKPLAESTRKKRRGDGNKAAILRDTSTMFLVFSPSIVAPGAIEKREERGIRVGFGGPAKHPKAKNFSISQLANAHHAGLGNLPARPVLDQPTRKALALMTRETVATHQRLLDKADQTNARPSNS